MFSRLIGLSLEKRIFVLLIAGVMLVGGGIVATRIPVDIFPDLSAPTVTILTDAHGMAPEEIETLVAFPIETAMNGATGVRRVRSSLSMGVAVTWVEFEWGTEIYKARQVVTEKLQSVASVLPEEVDPPMLAPVSSLMGEIMLVGVTSDTLTELELRSFADNILRRRLLSVPGVSQIVAIGGLRKEYQVKVDPERLAMYGITFEDVISAVRKSNVNAAGGVFQAAGQEFVIRGIGRVQSLADLRSGVITVRNGVPVLLEQVSQVEIGPAFRYGTASVNNKPAVIISVQKQPSANTLDLSKDIDRAVEELQALVGNRVKIDTEVFRQADFISAAIHNVLDALRDGVILVTIILLLFLGNWRTTAISLLAIPLSLVAAVLCMQWLGMTVNTMTLGGMAIAIGVLVDDAIIDVENVFRRLRANALLPEAERRSTMQVVYEASNEIRQPMLIATVIIIAVFLPLFFLSGVEGRLLQPLGFAFVISVFASLLVALTVVPALCYWMLPASLASHREESLVVRKLKKVYQPALEWSVRHSGVVIASCIVLFLATAFVFTRLGTSFLPEFNEGSATVIVIAPPGTNLNESADLGRMAEQLMSRNPAVKNIARRTGRGELDEHSFGSNQTEFEVTFHRENFDKEQVFDELRQALLAVPGAYVSVGQPISHRIDHMLSGTQAALAIKIFGPNLYELRRVAHEVKNAIADVEGLVDLAVEPQVDVPQLRIDMNREAMAMYGVQVSDLAENIRTAFNGDVVGQVLEGQNPVDLVVRYHDAARADDEAIARTVFSTPAGPLVPLRELANVYRSSGPNSISRENVSRKIVVQANVSGRDLGSTVKDVEERIRQQVALPDDYYVVFSGQFESAAAARRVILLLSLVSLGVIFVLLYSEFKSIRDSLLVLINLPLALVGGMFAVWLTNGVITIAVLVGFITLFGIAARNGILLVAHYYQLMNMENSGHHEAVIRGSLERMNPILMTAMCAGLALVPLALGGGEPGKEIQTPMAIVILGGLITSTFLNMVVIPSLFYRFCRKK